MVQKRLMGDTYDTTVCFAPGLQNGRKTLEILISKPPYSSKSINKSVKTTSKTPNWGISIKVLGEKSGFSTKLQNPWKIPKTKLHYRYKARKYSGSISVSVEINGGHI